MNRRTGQSTNAGAEARRKAYEQEYFEWLNQVLENEILDDEGNYSLGEEF